MGNIQLLISYKCCSSDEVDNDDYKEPEKPKLNQLPTITEDKIDKLVTISDDSFKTTIPCNFP